MLCLSIFLVNCFYIPLSLTKPTISAMVLNPFCNLVAFIFHYFLLTSFFWMLIVAVIQYMQFVRVFNSHISNFFIKSCFIGWVCPILFPFIVVLVSRYGGYFGVSRCWISDPILLYMTLIGPISLIILCNIALFILTMKSIFRHNNLSKSTAANNRSKLQFSAAVCCFVSIGSVKLIQIFIRFGFLETFSFDFRLYVAFRFCCFLSAELC